MFLWLAGIIGLGISIFAHLPCPMIEYDFRVGLGHEYKMNNLHCCTKDELNPKIPATIEIRLHETSYNGTVNRPSHGRLYDESHSILLIIRIPYVGNHPKSHSSTC